jgi:hypothetical protein
MTKRIGAILVVFLLFAGCATQNDPRFEQDGVQYGTTKGTFRGRWWSYYERGSSFLAGKYLDEAMGDFRTALQGRASDTWRARTYGLHFVEYFPNREIGVTLFHQGNLDEAEQYLTLSLNAVDTERTRYYLDEIKKARIANGSLKDNSEPELETNLGEDDIVIAGNVAPVGRPGLFAGLPKIASAGENWLTTLAGMPRLAAVTDGPIVLAQAPGAVTDASGARVVTEPVIPVEIGSKDDIGVVKVAVNGKQLPQRGSAQQLKFRDDIQVREGAQTVKVVATDLAQKETTKEVKVVVDLTGPTIGVFSPIEPTVTPEGAVTLDGNTTDNVGVSTISVGDRRIAEAAGDKKLPFNTSLPLGNGENVFVVAARDTGGNETRSAVKVFRGDPNSREAKLWLLKQKRPDFFVFASNGTGDLDTLLRIAQEQSKQPVNEIRLKSPTMDQPYRGSRTLRISGEVVTSSSVRSLSINGEVVNEISGAPKESFNKRVPIDPALLASGKGAMDINVVAVTTSGQTLEKTFTVSLEPVELASPASRMPVAVLAFAGAKVDAPVAEALRTATEQQLVVQKRFRAVDRTALAEVWNEQQITAALSNPDEAINLGGSVPAQVFLVADVFPHDAQGLEVKARVVSAETGDLVGTLDVFIDDKNNPELVNLKCADLVAQLTTIYPRISGEVVSVSGDRAVIDWSAEDGVRPGSYVLLLKKGAPTLDPVTGEVLAPGELREAGRARVESVSGDTRTVIIERKEEGAPVEQGMPAITM